jgi:hypothetical protein
MTNVVDLTAFRAKKQGEFTGTENKQPVADFDAIEEANRVARQKLEQERLRDNKKVLKSYRIK